MRSASGGTLGRRRMVRVVVVPVEPVAERVAGLFFAVFGLDRDEAALAVALEA